MFIPRRRRRRRRRRRFAGAYRRWHRRRLRRLITRRGLMLLVGYGAYKLGQRDARRIEKHTGRSADSLSEEELVTTMEDLNIKPIELTEDDYRYIEQNKS